MTQSARLNFRVRADTEQRLRSAASACEQTLTDFVLAAAEERADAVLAARTIVPAEYFAHLLAALDEPEDVNVTLRAAAQRPRQFTQL